MALDPVTQNNLIRAATKIFLALIAAWALSSIRIEIGGPVVIKRGSDAPSSIAKDVSHATANARDTCGHRPRRRILRRDGTARSCGG